MKAFLTWVERVSGNMCARVKFFWNLNLENVEALKDSLSLLRLAHFQLVLTLERQKIIFHEIVQHVFDLNITHRTLFQQIMQYRST